MNVRCKFSIQYMNAKHTMTIVYLFSWGIVEHQIPSIKVFFKTNTKGHKHPSIRLIKQQDTIGKPKKTKSAFSPGTAHSPEIQSYRTWWGAASPILNDTPVVYTTYNRTRIRNAHTHTHIYIYISTLIRRTFVDSVMVDHSDVVRASPVGAVGDDQT